MISRSGWVVLLVVAAAVVVAAVAGEVRLLVAPVELDEGAARGVRLAGAAAFVVGLAALLVLRRRLRPDGRRDPDPAVAGLVATATLMGLLALVAPDFVPGAGEGGGGDAVMPGAAVIDPDLPSTGPPPPPSSGAPVTRGRDVGPDRDEPEWRVDGEDRASGAVPADGGLDRALLRRVASLLLLVLVAVLAVLGLRALAGRRGARGGAAEPEPGPGLDPADAESGLEASLGEVAAAGDDPRARITAAYRRLIGALAEAGAPPRPHEAPHEHLDRALGPLGVAAGPMHRLADLYVLAWFGERPVTEGHRAEAAGALRAGLASLREAGGRPAAP